MSSPRRRPPVAVVIVNWDGLVELRECMSALRGQTRPPDAVVVVDNGSRDGSVAWLEEQDDVRLVRLDHNTGFAHAANVGIEAAGDADVLLLNNDVRADPGLVQALEDELAGASDRCGYATARLVRRHDRRMDAAGAFVDAAGVPGHRGMGAAMDQEEYSRPAVVNAACAAATLYRREMLDDIGLFAKDFFAYYEDADLSARGVLRGWHGSYVPDALAWHEVSATSSRIPGMKRYYGIRNSWWLLVRCVPTPLLPGLVLRHLAVHAVWVASAARHGYLRHALRAEAHALGHLPRALRQRRAIQSGATVTADDFRRTLVPAQTSGPWRRLRTRSRAVA